MMSRVKNVTSPSRKIGDPLYTTFQKIFTIIRIFLKSEAPKALYSSHSFIVSALTIGRCNVGAAYVKIIWLGFLLRLAVVIHHCLSRVVLLF